MFRFAHETLDAYGLAVEVARWFRRAQWPRGSAHLKDQGCRAMESAVLNIAEGRSRGGEKAGANHLRIALGSAAEACAVLDLVDLDEAAAQQEKLRRVGVMLTRLGR